MEKYTNLDDFGAAVVAARRRLGWSQLELAQRSGMSRPTIARVESGSDVSSDTIKKLASGLGINITIEMG